MSKLLILVVSLWVSWSPGFSSEPRFKQLTSKDGISQSEVYCFLHDQQGFIWFGTVDGHNKYDGYEIIRFNTEKNNINSLSNNTIRSLAEDNADNGMIRINPVGDTFYHGMEITLTAIPDDGYEFTGWSGDLSGSYNPASINMDGNKDVSAKFTLITGFNDQLNYVSC